MAKQKEFHAYGGAAELFNCRAPELCIEGPAGTGKSRAVGEYINSLCMQYPGCRILVFRKTRASLTESWMVTFENKVIPGTSIVTGMKRTNRASYHYPNGSCVVLGGMDNATRLFSTEYDIAYCNEANELTENEWESLHRALRNGVVPWQQLIGDCNPDAPGHWLNVRMNRGKTHRILSRHADNPTLDKEYLKRLSNLTGVRRKRLFLGEWAAAEGAVYGECWDPAVHMIARSDAPDFKWYFGSQDWGFKNPGVLQIFGWGEDDNVYRVKEIYRSRQTPDWWIERAKEMDKDYGMRSVYCGPDRPEHIESYRKAGVNAVPAENAVEFGINVVRDLLRPNDRKQPRLYFLRDSLIHYDAEYDDIHHICCSEQEFENYLYPESTEKRNQKENPVPKNDHGMDALRYGMMGLDRQGRVFSGTRPEIGAHGPRAPIEESVLSEVMKIARTGVGTDPMEDYRL